jgi:hypothetical protein
MVGQLGRGKTRLRVQANVLMAVTFLACGSISLGWSANKDQSI